MIPRPNTISSRFGAAMDTKRFFQMGWNLIESENAGTRQHVIAKLGAETGLAIIKTLTDIMDASQKDETTVSIGPTAHRAEVEKPTSLACGIEAFVLAH
jgi:hypothetical protein